LRRPGEAFQADNSHRFEFVKVSENPGYAGLQAAWYGVEKQRFLPVRLCDHVSRESFRYQGF